MRGKGSIEVEWVDRRKKMDGSKWNRFGEEEGKGGLSRRN